MTTSGSAIFFDGKTSARHDVTLELAPEALRIARAGRRAAGGVAAMTSSRPCRRPMTCCGWASSAIRCWRGWRYAIRHWRPRSTTSRCRSTAAAAPSGRCAGRSCCGRWRRPPRSSSSRSWVCRRSRPDWLRSFRYPVERRLGELVDARCAAVQRRPARSRPRMRRPSRRGSGPGGVRQADGPTGDGGRLPHPLGPRSCAAAWPMRSRCRAGASTSSRA